MRELPSFENFINEANLKLGLSTNEYPSGTVARYRIESDVINLRKVVNLSKEPWAKYARSFTDSEIGFESGSDRRTAMAAIQKSFDSGKNDVREFALNESEEINEGVFHRLPKNIISDELYLTSKNLQNFYDRTAAGNDVDPGVIDTIIRGLDKVKKAVKRFNSKDEVVGTVYEGEVLLYDEIGTELEDLKKKISGLMKSATDKKWVSALGTALTALSNLDRNLSQYDAKLGSIVTESEEVNEASVQVAGHGKPSGAKVLATVIIDALNKQDFLHPDTKKSQKQLIDMVANVIMDSTF